jgi:hypothetical protein
VLCYPGNAGNVALVVAGVAWYLVYVRRRDRSAVVEGG